MLTITLIAFAIRSHLGDPTRELAGQSLGEKERQALRQELGLDQPIHQQLSRFLGGAIRGDLGTSWFYKKPALQVIGERLPATLELAVFSLLAVLILAIPMGMFTALHPDSMSARLMMQATLPGLSTPVFLSAMILIYIGAVATGWFPAYGRGEVVNWRGFTLGMLTPDGRKHLVLPVLTLVLILLPLFLRMIRSELLETLHQDYVRTAWAKGMPASRVYFRHVLRNALPPIAALTGVQFGGLLAFTIITESIFQWPGMGLLFLEAVQRGDIPLVTAYLCVAGVIFILSNTVADLAVIALDPRTREAG